MSTGERLERLLFLTVSTSISRALSETLSIYYLCHVAKKNGAHMHVGYMTRLVHELTVIAWVLAHVNQTVVSAPNKHSRLSSISVRCALCLLHSKYHLSSQAMPSQFHEAARRQKCPPSSELRRRPRPGPHGRSAGGPCHVPTRAAMPGHATSRGGAAWHRCGIADQRLLARELSGARALQAPASVNRRRCCAPRKASLLVLRRAES